MKIPQTNQMITPGTMLSRYRIDSVLGDGRSGTVYLAFDTAIERTVAIKCLKMTGLKHSTARDQNSLNILFKEAKVVGQLNHPHIAGIFDMGTAEHEPYIVMEYVRGETLKSRLGRKHADRGSVPQILSFIVMVARALHYVHQRGILHGDVSPGNLMVTPQGTPKIMDFGVARRSLAPGQTKWSLAGEEFVSGTRGYLAPELLVGHEIDARADVFSLGAIAYEWLSGQKPYHRDDLERTTKALLQEELTPLPELGDFDLELCRDIEQAVARDPEKRYNSADAMADALEVYLEREHHQAYPTGILGGRDSKASQTLPRVARKNVLFADFSETELRSVMQMAHREFYKEGDVILQEGAGGSMMYVLVKGRVSIRKMSGNQEIEIKQVPAGECFGEMAVISQLPRSASVVALRPVEVIAVSGAVLRSASPTLCMKLYRNIAGLLSDRVRQRDEQILTLLKPDGVKRAEKRRFGFW